MANLRQRINFEVLLGISAIFLSLAALIVSIVQTRIAREQQQSSAWPYLQLTKDHEEDDFALKLTNNGVGPALIRKVGYTYKGVVYSSHTELLQSVAKSKLSDSVRNVGGQFYGNLTTSTVLKAGDEVDLYAVIRNETKALLFDEVVVDTSFHVRIHYADVYGNCWLLDQNKVTQGNCPE